jgi:transposase, IS5 family
LIRTAKRLAAQLPGVTGKVCDRSRAVQTRMRTLSRTLRRRSGEAQAEVERLTTEAASRLRATVREAKKVLDQAKQAIAEIGAKFGQEASRFERRLVAELKKFLLRAERVLEQVRQRFANEKIKDRPVSMFDPDARPPLTGQSAWDIKSNARTPEPPGLASVKGGYPGPQVEPMYPLAG